MKVTLEVFHMLRRRKPHVLKFHKRFNKLEKVVRNHILFHQKEVHLVVFQNLFTVDIYLVWSSVTRKRSMAKEIRVKVTREYSFAINRVRQEIRLVLDDAETLEEDGIRQTLLFESRKNI